MLNKSLDRNITPLSTLGLVLAKALKQYSDQELIQWLTDDDPIMREAVAKALHMRSNPETFDAVVKLTRHNRHEFREAACIVLGQFGTPDYPFIDKSMDCLTDLLSDTYFEVQAAALYAFGHLTGQKQPDDVGRKTIFDMVRHDRQEVREALAFALLSMQDPLVEETLETLKKDDFEPVRDMAEWCSQARG